MYSGWYLQKTHGCVFFCIYVANEGSAVGWLFPPEKALAQTKTGSGGGR
jgi:hypothetical protein